MREICPVEKLLFWGHVLLVPASAVPYMLICTSTHMKDYRNIKILL